MNGMNSGLTASAKAGVLNGVTGTIGFLKHMILILKKEHTPSMHACGLWVMLTLEKQM
jgi:hypothetical protein